MGIQETSKTLDEASVMSKSGQPQNPSGETLEEASGFSSYSDKCTELASATELSARENGCVANVTIIDKENNVDDEIRVVDAGKILEGAEVLGNSKSCPNFGGTKTVNLELGDASQSKLVDSGNNVEVSGNGISIYVEVFGPLNGIVQDADSNCLAERRLFGNDLNEENMGNVNAKGSISEVRNCSLDENAWNDVDGNAVDNQPYRFSFGDFVWAKAKSQLWWPGLVCEPSETSMDSTEPDKRDSVLVKCFGSGGLLWCGPSQLKPFHEYFEIMSRQSDSKNFIGAVEKAVAEIGRHVKLEMTCPCFPEESRNCPVSREGGDVAAEEKCKLGKFPVIQFEPANLLARIKYLAQDVSVPGKIEFAVIQNQLSAFYRSLGHPQVAMHQLKPTTDTKSIVQDGLTENKVLSVEYGDGGTDGKSAKGYISRERRKSKYLSFPYVDLEHGPKSLNDLEEKERKDPVDVSNLGEDKKSADGQSMGSTPMVKSSGKKSRKRSAQKSSAGHDISDKLEVINVSSTVMLSELRFTALDCLYPGESKKNGWFERFFSRYRRFAFRDLTHVIASEYTGTPDANKTDEIRSGRKDPNIKSKPKRRKMAKTADTGSNSKPKEGILENITKDGSVIIDFQKMDPHASESQSVPKKRQRKTVKTPGIPQIKVIAGLPDLNGRSTGFQLEGRNIAGSGAPRVGKLEPRRKKEATSANLSMTNSIIDINGSIGENGAVLKDVELVDLHSVQNVPDLNKEGIREAATLDENGEITSIPPDVNKNAEPSTGVLSPCGKPERKKRKRKPKRPDCHTNVIPDLNGNSSEPRVPEMNCVPPEGKHQIRRRRRKKNSAGVLDINQNNGEALLLKFAPKSPMPSKEDLVSKFCMFGPLKESETLILNDSFSAQVVFTNSSDARNAFRSLEKSSPFGSALVNYRLHIILADLGASEPKGGGLNMDQAWPVEEVKSPRKPRTSKKPKTPGNPSGLKPSNGVGHEAPDLQFVRQNLQMMKSMLENAGDNLSPEMRAKLEIEIKSLMQKVSTMVGPSSSS